MICSYVWAVVVQPLQSPFKSPRDFWMLRWSTLFLMNTLRFGQCLHLGLHTSMMTVLWSAMPSSSSICVP